MDFASSIEIVGKTIDVVGVAVICAGIVLAAVRATRRPRDGVGNRYRDFRQSLGRSILLGLEFLVAADIIRTVAVTPTVTSVIVLGAIVAIRTFLSFSLELEITGSWPWAKREHASSGASADDR